MNQDMIIPLLVLTGTILAACALPSGASAAAKTPDADLHLIPYPQEVKRLQGTLPIRPAKWVTDNTPSETEKVAIDSLQVRLPKTGKEMLVRLGSVEEGYKKSWLTTGEKSYLSDEKTSPEASILKITPDGITVVGKGRWGMLYGVQTVNQLLMDAVEKKQNHLPCVLIRDWPDMKWRCLSPSMTWYSGYNRLEGYDLNNWTLDEWKWLVDWSLLHKCNGWAMCIYGNWPFTLGGYPETTLDVDSFFYDPVTGKKTPWRFTHKNIKKEFIPELIRYANERGVQMYAYIGKNSFNGTYGLKHPEADAGGAAELIPFAPGVHEYWDAYIRRFIELGFNGFVFEDPEAMHVPNQNQQCYDTFWKPWEKEYGFKSIAETNQNNPPLGVHVEYYSWLFREFDSMICKHAAEFGRPTPEIYLISHILLSRMVSESKTPEERNRWFAYIDEKQGRKVPFIIQESDEKKYVEYLGHDRVASLGGRGGSCTCAMRRIASINNNWCGGGMGGCLDWERQCQERIYQAGGFGAMGYIFEWTNTEVFGYIASQYLWRNSGVPGINNDDQTSFMYYAYPMYYGEKVGKLVAQAMDEGPAVNDAMVFEGVYGSQWPTTGQALHRDYQLLARLSDHGLELARQAYKLYTGKDPELFRPVYDQEGFRWNGFDPSADKRFKAERLRLLYVSMKRSQLMCECALAHRKAQALIAQGATAGEVLRELDKSVKAAEENQKLYSANYDDDYDWTDGLCSKVTDHIRMIRDQFASANPDLDKPVPESIQKTADRPLFIPWVKMSDIVPARKDAEKPGLYLSTAIGLDQRYDMYNLGVVFTVEALKNGSWQTIFRRALDRRRTDWERWDIPVPAGSEKIRFVTDSYSRAMDRSTPSWKWALWGGPKLVELSKDGKRTAKYDFAVNIDEARAMVRLDSDGKDRPFDGTSKDSTGATFSLAEPGVVERIKSGEGKSWQWVEGFKEWIDSPSNFGVYPSYLGSTSSGWAYSGKNQAFSWSTDVVSEPKETAVIWVGGTGYAEGKCELWCDDKKLVVFDMFKTKDMTWKDGGVELRFIFGGDTRGEKTPYGVSGIYLLKLPASMVTPGKPLKLSIKTLPGQGDWYMVHGYHDVSDRTRGALAPDASVPAIAAFTPHLNGSFGLTVAEYDIKLDK